MLVPRNRIDNNKVNQRKNSDSLPNITGCHSQIQPHNRQPAKLPTQLSWIFENNQRGYISNLHTMSPKISL